MGQNLMHQPPKFVQGFIDRHGRPRFYFRRPGFKRMPLPSFVRALPICSGCPANAVS
jgi:hypothetical protein